MDLLSSDSDEENVREERLYRPRQYYELENFAERFRLTRLQVDELLLIIGPLLEAKTLRGVSLSATDKALCSLRYYASGSFYYSVGDAQGPSKSAVCSAVHQVTAAINQRMFQSTIRWPDRRNDIAQRFFGFGGMPCVAACVDGTLVPILAPSEHESQFVDRHNQHSISAQFACGPDMLFYSASVRWPGAVNDARVMRNSRLHQTFEAGWRPFDRAIILGDSAYALKQWLIPPIMRPVTAEERRFNRAHKKTRRLIECAYGIFKETWQCLYKLRVKTPIFACEVIKACAVLHNFRAGNDGYDRAAGEHAREEQQTRMRDFGLETEADTDEDDGNGGDGRDAGIQRRNELVASFAR